jgi:hypothetical protein
MLDKYGIHESRVLQKLFDDRRWWIASYFKEIFCGTVTSTQRSESVNNVIKHGYCDNSTAIHEFAKSFLELLEHTKENESREEYNSQVKTHRCLLCDCVGNLACNVTKKSLIKHEMFVVFFFVCSMCDSYKLWI